MVTTSSTSANIGVAQAILGESFITPEETGSCLREKLPHDSLRHFNRVPFSEKTLEDLAATHILVPDLGVSIDEFRRLLQGNFLQMSREQEGRGQTPRKLLRFPTQDWYAGLPFAEYPYQMGAARRRWQLISKEPLNDSFGLSLNDQLKLIEPDGVHGKALDRVVTAQELVYTIIVVILTRGECIYQGAIGRCLDPVTERRRAAVGCSRCQDQGGRIIISCLTEEHKHPRLGLATARVPNRP